MSLSELDLSALNHLPEPSPRRIAVGVSAQAEKALHRGHPWVFERSIVRQSRTGAAGDLAVVFDHQRKFLAVGLYDPGDIIRVRVLQHRQPASIDRTWFEQKIAAAFELRRPLWEAPLAKLTNGYRLVHGEGDGLPGLVIDKYAGTFVIKLYSLAWMAHLKPVCQALLSILPAERLVLRLSRKLLDQPEKLFGLRDGEVIAGTALQAPLVFQENGLYFEADPVYGHKTGFYFDQRENRARLEQFASGKSVLNLFAYTGGFSVYAARGGARHILSVDISQPALEAALRNMAYNQHLPQVASAGHEIVAADVFDFLTQAATAGRRFDLVIVDPPAFAHNQRQVAAALAAYAQLTRLSLRVLQPGGVLVQASCSSRVGAAPFFETVRQAAESEGRPLHEIERTGHACDHPIAFKEGAYLKCLFAQAA
ncbi:MAG: class I SAM-dependent rRNA methyltransferase [Anaerolineales bacterium]